MAAVVTVPCYCSSGFLLAATEEPWWSERCEMPRVLHMLLYSVSLHVLQSTN